MIVMDAKTQLKVDIITKVSEGKIKICNAEKILNKSRRTIERYLKEYREIGIQFAIHKNSNRAPVNKTSDSTKKKTQELIKKKYYDFNLTHLQEKLLDDEKIEVKRETLRSWAHEIHHVKRAKKRRAKPRKKRDRMTSPGLLLQMDGSPDRWFGNTKSCLIAIIDDANSEVEAEFFESETSLGCLKVLKDLISKKGVFKTLYVDRAGIFGGPKRCNFAQVKRACEELGIEIIFANSAEAKGRIERSFDTFQDRLIPELRLNNIISMEEANIYLKNTFIPTYWNKNIVVIPENLTSEYSRVPRNKNIDDILVIKEYRSIRNDHTFSYGNKFYLIESDLKYSIAKQKIEIRTEKKDHFKAFFSGKELEISEVKEPSKLTMIDLEIQKKLDAIVLSEKLQSVSEAARISKCSRQTIYKNRKILQEKGMEALKRKFRKDHHHGNRASKDREQFIIDYSLENPHLGQAEVSRQLMKEYQIEISPGGVRNIWLRHDMQTVALRMQKKAQRDRLKAA